MTVASKLKIAFGTFLLLLSLSVSANEKYDKQMHVAATTVIAGSFSVLTDDFSTGFFMGAAAGIAKELYDKERGQRLESGDFAADLIGSVIGASLGKGVRVLIDNEKTMVSFRLSF